jgi:2'-5' RNA ligase
MTITDIAESYALWLRPETNDQKYLIEIVTGLSATYKAISFEPHCTLLSGIVLSIAEIEKYFKENFQYFSSIILKTSKIDYTNYLKKSLYIKFEKSDALSLLFARISESFEPREERILNPHLSLLYKTIPTEEKIRIINSISLKKTITFNKFVLVEIGQNFGDWKTIFVKNI